MIRRSIEIDPLKINVTAVADVMSRAFAERHRILAVEVNDDEVVIASSEPYIQAWESNLEHVLRKPMRRVLADPGISPAHRRVLHHGRVRARRQRRGQRESGVGREQPGADAGSGLHEGARCQRPAHRQYCRLVAAVRF